MSWESTSVTNLNSSSSSMGSNTALNRSLNAVPASKRITSYLVEWKASIAAGSTTYNSIGTGTFAQEMPWIFGISYVLTSGTVPNLSSSPDDPQFIAVWYNPEYYDRQTINSAGSPTYKDIFSWHGTKRGKVQIPSGTGGHTYWHVANDTAGTVVTDWTAFLRITYA